MSYPAAIVFFLPQENSKCNSLSFVQNSTLTIKFPETENESEIVLPATCQLWEDLWGVITGEDWHHWDINQNIIVYLSPLSTVRYKNMIKAIEKLKSTKPQYKLDDTHPPRNLQTCCCPRMIEGMSQYLPQIQLKCEAQDIFSQMKRPACWSPQRLCAHVDFDKALNFSFTTR